MKNCPCIYVFFITVASLFLVACSNDSARMVAFGDDVAITWELKSNFADNGKAAQMELSFTNNGKKRLDGEGWTLYFTQNNCRVIPNNCPMGTVEHVNGYLYKMTPTEEFSLKAGETIKVDYLFMGAVGKVEDGPVGILYFVFNEGTPDEKIVKVKNYAALPFDREEQLMWGADDVEPIMTPARRYELNQKITPVPQDQLTLITPAPVEMRTKGGTTQLNDGFKIVYQKEVESESKWLQSFFVQQFGTNIPAEQSGELNGKADLITLKLGNVVVNGRSEEAYTLTISPEKGVLIEGSDATGLYYGLQSFVQLLPLELFKGDKVALTFPTIEVKDAPRFAYRGQHFDVSRHHHSVEKLKQFITLISHYKLNKLELRITDDEGWRLEIPGLPELTEIGSKRGHEINGWRWAQPAFGSGPIADDPEVYGNGFYTKDQYVDILRFAAKHHVEVITEVCFPSHVRSAIVAMENRYERLMKEGKQEEALEYRLRDPNDRSIYLSAQMFKDNVACMGMESTYHFYDKVVGEISKMYTEAGLPFRFFHTGGDELADGAWMGSPLCKPFIDQLEGAKNTTNLNSVCFNRLLGIVKNYAELAGGWEEVGLKTDGEGKKYPNPLFAEKNVVPYVWNNLFGEEDLGYRLANAGYPVVLCNVSNFYFDMAYDKDPNELGLHWGGLTTAKDGFYFAPFDMFKTTVADNRGKLYTDDDFKSKERLKPDARKNILGLQAQLWGETLFEEQRIDHYMLPKLPGFATSAWSAERKFETIDNRVQRLAELDRAWNIFANSIGQRDMKRWDALFGGFDYRIDPPGAVIKEGRLYANNEYPGFVIRYTTDGSEPTVESVLYSEPIEASGTIRLKSFNDKGRASRTSVVANN